MPNRLITAERLALLRENYRRMPCVALAAMLGITLRQVYAAANRYALSRTIRRGDESFVASLREKVALGWCNQHIAAQFPPLDRHTVTDWRRRLGLAASRGPACPECRQRTRATTRRQLDAAGLDSLGALRVAAFRNYAVAHGWPADLRPRAVQILEALRRYGPMTRQQIAAAIGMPWKGARNSLCSNDPEGSYLAHLQGRGLAVRLGRIVRGRGRGRSVNLYAIAADVRQASA